MAMFLAAIPVSNMIGAPISGFLLGLNWMQMAGWRWLLILEGLPAVIFGVVDGKLVVANDAKRAGAAAASEPADVPGASGSVTVSADAEELVARILSQFGSELGLGGFGSLGVGMFTRPLGDLNGWMSASPDELRGKLTLAVE